MSMTRLRPWYAAPVALALALALAAGACGDGAGDAIVLTGGAAGAPSSAGTGGAPAAGALCAACETSADCTAGPCLVLEATGARFCGSVCAREADCAAGYTCVLPTGTTESSCVPTTGNCAALGTGEEAVGCPAPDVALSFILEWVNAQRASAGVAAYTLDTCLTGLAQAGSDELAATGLLQGKFQRECVNIVPDCECNWQQENQALSVRSGMGWTYNVERTLTSMAEGGPGSASYENLVATEYSRLGIGVYCDQNGQQAIVTLDFGP